MVFELVVIALCGDPGTEGPGEEAAALFGLGDTGAARLDGSVFGPAWLVTPPENLRADMYVRLILELSGVREDPPLLDSLLESPHASSGCQDHNQPPKAVRVDQ